MAVEITQHQLDHTDLIVIVGRDGTLQWAAYNRSRGAVADLLRQIADGIENGEL